MWIIKTYYTGYLDPFFVHHWAHFVHLWDFCFFFCPWQFLSKTFRKCAFDSQCIQVAAQVIWCHVLVLRCKFKESNFLASKSTSPIAVNSVPNKCFTTWKLCLQTQMTVFPPTSVEKRCIYPGLDEVILIKLSLRQNMDAITLSGCMLILKNVDDLSSYFVF